MAPHPPQGGKARTGQHRVALNPPKMLLPQLLSLLQERGWGNFAQCRHPAPSNNEQTHFPFLLTPKSSSNLCARSFQAVAEIFQEKYGYAGALAGEG